MHRNPGFIPGWTYMGFVLLEGHPELKDLKRGETRTVKHEGFYILYENKGWVSATGRRPLINWHRRRFKYPKDRGGVR